MRIHDFISRVRKASTFVLWRYERDLSFPHVWLGGWKSERMEKLFYLVEKKNRMIKILICLNLFSCLYYIKNILKENFFDVHIKKAKDLLQTKL